ncbi:MAG TPA: hypothetical protein DCO77_02725 [Nitrospiraceae bacterium]|nr:hypothetical protein [Nitrospiraceae bacterium]
MLKLTAEAKVGLLVLAGSVMLLYMTFAVGKYEFGDKGYTIVTTFDSVAGIDSKAVVRMAGVKIGSVEKVELIDSKARLTLRIWPDVLINRGSKAVIRTMGLLGEKYVEIVPGPPPKSNPHPPDRSSYFQEGEEIRVTVSPSDIDRLITQLNGISDDIKSVTTALRQAFGGQKGARSMEDILADLRSTMANVEDFSQTLRSDGSELVMRLNEMAENINGVVAENRDNFKVTMENVREASRNAELALASIDNIARKIERGEGTLGKLVTDDSMYNNIDTAAKGIGEVTARLSRMKTIVGFRSEYMFPDVKNYFTLSMMPRPNYGYIFEINNDPYGKYKRSTVVTTVPSTITYETYEDRLKFSVMFAKRWGNLAARVGFIESEGGFGGDYYLFDDAVKLSFAAWNFNSTEPGNEKTHMKAGVEFSIGKVVFLNAGYDNFANEDRAAAYAGIGIRFNDDDLKYLLGSVPGI